METENDIVKSFQDKRNYRYVKLPNDLKVLLVSDEETEKASAALSIRVGGLCDPPDIPGLAHFCEHMLFLGTEKYPSENDYAEFVSHHGGQVNAFTSDEYTTYFFDVASDHLGETLDRFAQFFVCPLFNADSKDREVNAVESENVNNLQVDQWRYRQICKATCSPDHPYSKFISGSKYTLDTRPKELGIDVRDALLNFHSSYYSSNVMTLVVLGKESLDQLSDLVLELFSSIKNKCLPVPTFALHPYSDKELQLWLEYVPVKDVRQLNFEFPLPDLMQYYDCDPCMYVAHLIGHEGKGSLLSLLRARGWCIDLQAGPSMGAKGFMFFMISVDLTEDGEEHVVDIAGAVFQYFAMLKKEGPKEWIFKECSDLDEIEFRFKDKEKPISYAVSLTRSLNYFPPREVLSGGMMCTYRPDLIEMVLEKLRPHCVRIGFLSKKFEGKTTLVEPWYSSGYNARKIESKLIEVWSNTQPVPELHLPQPNEFIPTDFTIVSRPENGGEGREDDDDGRPMIPVLIEDTPMTKVWFKQDVTFLYPKANLCFRLVSPLVYKDPACYAQTLLFVLLLGDDLKEYSYNAEVAGISYNITSDLYGLKLRLEGYNHKQVVLLSKIMDRMTHFMVDPKKFDIFKEQLSRKFKNFEAEQPYSHAIYYTDITLDSQAWTKDQAAAALLGVTSHGLQDFIREFFSQVLIEALLHGNLSKNGCLELVKVVEDALRSGCGSKPLSSPVEQHRQVRLPDCSAFLYTAKCSVHSSHCVELYLQVGVESTRSKMLLELLSQVLHEPCFDTLRTKEQLGYIVISGLRAANGVLGFHILVQSMKLSSLVEKRVEAFLLKMQSILSSMTEESFEAHKKALAVKRSEKPKTLVEETVKSWTEILSHKYHFNRDKVEVACLKTISRDDILEFFAEHIIPGAAQRHKLTVHVLPTGQNAAKLEGGKEEEEVDCPQADGEDELDGLLPRPTPITDLSEFKSKLPLYPKVEPYTRNSLVTPSLRTP